MKLSHMKLASIKLPLLICLFTSSLLFVCPSFATAASEGANTPLVYINQNIGFNVKGYKYKQSEFPCEIDKVLVSNLVERAQSDGIRLEAVATADKIRNGVIPVLAIDIEQLVLGGQDRQFGVKQSLTLPKVQVTAALIKGGDMVTAKHTCAIATLNEFTPSSNILDLGNTGTTVCSATQKCLRDLSKDVVAWMAPQLK